VDTSNICLVVQHKFIVFSLAGCQLRGNSIIDNIVFSQEEAYVPGSLFLTDKA
jgi:hypothetical protein